jgi:FSR family fosmidomycin resistance protein-like MFS transporter
VHTFAGLLGSAAAPGSVLFMHGLFGWRGAFVGAAILGVLAALVLLAFPHDEPAQTAPKPRDTKSATAANWRLLLSAPILMSFLFFTLLAFSNFGLQSYTVVALGALYGTSPATANAALSANLIFSAAGVIVGGWIAARTLRHALAAGIGMLVSAIGTLVIGLVDLNAALLIAVMSVSGLFLGAIMPSRDMIVREITPPGAFGKVFGFVTNGFNIGGIVSPLVFGALMDHGEPRLVFLGIAAIGLMAVVSVVSVPRRTAD